MRSRTSRRHSSWATIATVMLATPVFAQEKPNEGPGDEPPVAIGPPVLAAPEPRGDIIKWPRDRNRVLCIVKGQRHTVEDLLIYLDARHAPLTLELAGTAAGRGLFESRTMRDSVRQYADIMAMREEAKALGVAEDTYEAAVSASLKRGFEQHLEEWTANREKVGRPTELTQDRINILLEHYQSRNGLRLEVQGWLDVLVPETPLEADGLLRQFYRDHPRFFGGRVTLSHILVRHRDPSTGRLLTGEEGLEVVKKIADVRSRLADDGSSFEKVARLLSEDRKTAAEGGLLREVSRFDPRLPSALCRAAWNLRDGQFTRVPVETPYGLHFVKCVAYNQRKYAYYHQDLKPAIQTIKRQLEQENLLWQLRDQLEVKLLY